MRVSVLYRYAGVAFPNKDKQKRKLAIDDNRKAIEEAAALGTSLIVLVCGADPTQSLEDFETTDTGWYCSGDRRGS